MGPSAGSLPSSLWGPALWDLPAGSCPSRLAPEAQRQHRGLRAGATCALMREPRPEAQCGWAAVGGGSRSSGWRMPGGHQVPQRARAGRPGKPSPRPAPGRQGGRGEGPRVAAGSRFGDTKSCVVPEGKGDRFLNIGLVAFTLLKISGNFFFRIKFAGYLQALKQLGGPEPSREPRQGTGHLDSGSRFGTAHQGRRRGWAET